MQNQEPMQKHNMNTGTVRAFKLTRFKAAGLLALALLGGCAVGPDYQRPEIAVGESYGEIQGWVQANPADTELRGDWWKTYSDPELNRLMDDLLASNLSIVQAEAQYRQAQALVQSASAGFFPTVGVNASVARSGSGSGSGQSSFSGTSGSSGNANQQYALNGSVSWEPDVWGKVRRSVESSQAGEQASAADLANTRLSMQSTLAQTYFRLRALDAEKRLFDQTVAAYERSLRTTRNRYEAGVAGQSDVAVAQTQLENAKVQQLALNWQRAQLEHALAVLVGKTPSAFSLKPTLATNTVPVIPIDVPSKLLQRRPDVAAAERRTAAANAQIGVAQAAWFPDLTLSAQGGYRSGQWAQWLTAPFSFWSLGPTLAMTIFDGGARQAQIKQARAGYDVQVASYRLTVLTALREVEDYLVQLRVLEQEQLAQNRALESARESLRLIQNQYDAGLIDYLSLVQVETAALSAERSALSMTADRLVASVQLIAALGGGWQAAPSMAAGLSAPAPALAPAPTPAFVPGN
ncbi:NodT family efflux transporter outer membrane factor (OMF) lipoprotein OS=Eoetvoesiella caeni OX=645616 GN=DFR37_107197 PE=3 SV=1 [Eoetvoesiella caeni]